jgi:hypothetical protein
VAEPATLVATVTSTCKKTTPLGAQVSVLHLHGLVQFYFDFSVKQECKYFFLNLYKVKKYFVVNFRKAINLSKCSQQR